MSCIYFWCMENQTSTPDLSLRKVAILTGTALLAMAAIAGFSYGYVHGTLIVAGDPTATAENLMSSEGLFRAGIFEWAIILILDVVVAWGLYVFLKSAHQSLSLLTAWLRIVYSAILGIAIANLILVLLLVSGSDHLQGLGTEQLNAHISLFLDGFTGVWNIGLIVFGLHLLVLGYLAFKSGFMPRILGILLLFAGLCYTATNSAGLLWPEYETYQGNIEMILAAPMAIGELALAFWLIIKGGKAPKQPSIR